MNAAKIYEILFTTEQTISVKIDSERDFSNLRRDLQRHHKLMTGIGGTALSLASVYLGKEARFRLIKRNRNDYQITIIEPTEEVNPDGTQVRSTMGAISEE